MQGIQYAKEKSRLTIETQKMTGVVATNANRV